MKMSCFFTLLFVFTARSHAITWEVIGQKSASPTHSGSLDVSLTRSVGETTIDLLTNHGISYSGSAAGIQSILGTPTGDAALVVVSNEEMRAYGWCFSVDGKIPDDMPDKVFFPSQESKLQWFFAFSVYLKGEWTEYCVPAYTKPLHH